MDFRRKSRPRIERKPEFENLEQRYPHNVMLYKLPPTEDINIQEFEDLALERLKVLRIFEQASSKGLRFLSDDWKEFINAELTREGLRGYLKLCTASVHSATTAANTTTTTNNSKWEFELQARRRDYISHFILRLAYCRTEELRRWFLTREMELFKYKFSALSSAEIRHFLDLNKLNYIPLTEAQKDAVKDGLYESTMGQSVARIELLDFYRVPFTQVLDLVRTRRCYLKEGFAYVNTHDFVSIVAVTQLQEVEHGVQAAQRLIREVETDERLFHLLKSLHTTYTGKDYTLNKDAVSVPIESLDQLSKKSMPLCMRACHEHLREHHHMKHAGRMQYGLFLKGIGVTLEDSIRFWRDEFTKKMDADRFAKSYEYNIHHNYGKKGSMINYTPYSCLKIIQEQVVPGDVNGCPYKLYDQATLKTKLTANGLGAAHLQEVMGYVAKGHFQLACGKYFQLTHESPHDLGITHPNQYFEESQILMGHRAAKTPAAAAAGSAVRKPIKRSANDTTALLNADDDDELWQIAETQEKAYRSAESEKATSAAWEEELDLTEIEF